MIGYGKLGGIELGYGSDLDLVFLHDSAGDHQLTTGPKVVDNPVFFARLGQRIIHLLNTHTAGGILYEVDMRLRPSGASGLLVSDLEAFRRYQLEEAWTWEHQALVRARPVAGDSGPAEAFRQIRAEVLCRARDPQTLQQEVVDMRERMRRELGGKRSDRFDLKQDAGGIADIEFMVQYLILRWASEYPEIIEFTDNIRQLEALARSGRLPDADASSLIAIYQQYRNRGHHQVLCGEPDTVEAEAFAEQRGQVIEFWQRLMLEPPA
jgi:glutamate-ammonia-ligase adenylyltransferase